MAGSKVASATAITARLLSIAPTYGNILFSSVAALLGSAGQANYSASNAALDALASQSSASGLPVTSIQFGPWAAGGMAAATAAKGVLIGIGALTPQQGLAALEGALRSHSAAYNLRLGVSASPTLAASPFHWPTFLQKAKIIPPLLSELALPLSSTNARQSADQTVVVVSGTRAAAVAEPRQRAMASATEAAAAQASRVRGAVALAVTGVIGSAVADDAPLLSSGLDSLGAVELRNALEGRLSVQLPSTLVFDYPTIDAISSFILATTQPSPAALGAAAAELPAPHDAYSDEEDEETDNDDRSVTSLSRGASSELVLQGQRGVAARSVGSRRLGQQSFAPATKSIIAITASACRMPYKGSTLRPSQLYDAIQVVPHTR